MGLRRNPALRTSSGGSTVTGPTHLQRPRARRRSRTSSSVTRAGAPTMQRLTALRAHFDEQEIVEITWVNALEQYFNRASTAGSGSGRTALRARRGRAAASARLGHAARLGAVALGSSASRVGRHSGRRGRGATPGRAAKRTAADRARGERHPTEGAEVPSGRGSLPSATST